MRFDGPVRALLAALALAVLLACLPSRWSAALKDPAAVVLRPGQRLAGILQEGGRLAWRTACAQAAAGSRLLEAEAQIERLREQNIRLRRELAALRVALRQGQATGCPQTGSTSLTAAPHPAQSAQPLLHAAAIPARVLGMQARAFLARRGLLDVGFLEGVEDDALVLEPPPLLDQGRDAQVAPGQLVLHGAAVWGRIVEVGEHVSTVCPVTAPGFRDVVQLVDPQAGMRLGPHCPRGLLEGTGEPLARIRSIDITQPVAVGDLVVSASVEGIVSEPLIHGRVVRVERPPGASSWEIWMEPAVPATGPKHVWVLRAEPNPRRLAKHPSAAGTRQSTR